MATETATTARSTAPTQPRRRLSGRVRSERRLALMLVSPAIIVMTAVAGYPLLYAVWLSLQRSDLRFPGSNEFIGLSNYGTVLTSPVWWQDVLHTTIITVASVSIELVIGMLLALVMHRAIYGRGPVRTAILIPYGIITVVAALTWRYAVTPDLGWIPGLLGLDSDPLTTVSGSYITIIVTEVWKTTPFMALLLLAGLALVPDELQEAAKVDGASALQRFFRITLPLMKPAILVALLFRTLDAFRVFDTVFVQTGGANKTETVSLLAYNTLLNRLNLGLGSAVSILIFVLVALIAFVLIRAFGGATVPGSGEAN